MQLFRWFHIFSWVIVVGAGTSNGQSAGEDTARSSTILIEREEKAAPGGGVKIRSFRGADVRIIRRQLPQSRVSPSVTKTDLDSLESRLLGAIERRLQQMVPSPHVTVISPPQTKLLVTPPPTIPQRRQEPSPSKDTTTPPVVSPVASTDTITTQLAEAIPEPAITSDPSAEIEATPPTLVTEIEKSMLETGLFRTITVVFEINKARLLPVSRQTLDAVGEVLRKHPSVRLRIEGHTDSTGRAEHNLALSRKRAEAVRQYILDVVPSIEPERLTAEGYGMERPVASNATPTGRALNRRVEFRVLER